MIATGSTTATVMPWPTSTITLFKEARLNEQWNFNWVNQPDSLQHAHVTGQLRWGGYDWAFEADGLAGVDGRLAAPSLDALPLHLRQVVLHHFAEECLKPLAVGPLSDLAVTALCWHEDSLPMQGEFEFTVRRAGVRGVTRGRLTPVNQAGRAHLLAAMSLAHWPLPQALAHVTGQLQVGSLRLTPLELAHIEPGDLVWVDEAELSPLGLRAHFHGEGRVFGAWIKRSVMTRDGMPHGGVSPAGITTPALQSVPSLASTDATTIDLPLRSPMLSVARAWLHGAQAEHSLPTTALTFTWAAHHDQQVTVEGRLLVVGRRLGLRVSRVLVTDSPEAAAPPVLSAPEASITGATTTAAATPQRSHAC